MHVYVNNDEVHLSVALHGFGFTNTQIIYMHTILPAVDSSIVAIK